MRIVLFHPWIYLKSGLERTILELARRSRHDWEIYTTHYDADGTYPELRAFNIREVSKVSVQRNYGAVLQASARIAMTKLDLKRADALVVCCDGVGSFITLRNGAVPIVNLCFTPLRAAYDDEYRKRHLARQSGRVWLALLMEKAYIAIDRALWRRYRKVVCISETIRERVTQAGLYPRDEMLVMYPGVDAAAIAPSERFERFFFVPGRIMWTKNIELGIAAFLKFRARTGSDYRLVIAGMVDAKGEEYFARLRAMAGEDSGVEFRVGPTDREMHDLYERCCGVLFTAFNEDLGLTPMEAMARGKPVIAVNKGGPREVVEHEVTGYLVEGDPEPFCRAMESLVADEARLRAMGRAGAERVKRFTWDRFVDDMDSLLDSAVEAPAR